MFSLRYGRSLGQLSLLWLSMFKILILRRANTEWPNGYSSPALLSLSLGGDSFIRTTVFKRLWIRYLIDLNISCQLQIPAKKSCLMATYWSNKAFVGKWLKEIVYVLFSCSRIIWFLFGIHMLTSPSFLKRTFCISGMGWCYYDVPFSGSVSSAFFFNAISSTSSPWPYSFLFLGMSPIPKSTFSGSLYARI